MGSAGDTPEREYVCDDVGMVSERKAGIPCCIRRRGPEAQAQGTFGPSKMDPGHGNQEACQSHMWLKLVDGNDMTVPADAWKVVFGYPQARFEGLGVSAKLGCRQRRSQDFK